MGEFDDIADRADRCDGDPEAPAPPRRRGSSTKMKVERFAVAHAAAATTREAPQYGDLSEDQQLAFDALLDFAEARTAENFITLGGLSGTGKTTITVALAKVLIERGTHVVFTAYTGKAVDVLARKLRSYGIAAECKTLHSLVYIPREERDPKTGLATGRVAGWETRPFIDADLVIVDEASMLGAELWEDLQSYGKPIIAVGDHGQLPPIGSSMISLMQNPQLRLEKIHRQAEGNPIIALAHHVRAGGTPKTFKHAAVDDRVQLIRSIEQALPVLASGGLDVAAICYFNKTRTRYNWLIRQARNYAGPDTVICLKNTDRVLFNGMRGLLEAIDGDIATIAFPDNGLRVTAKVCLTQFGREKTYASFAEAGGRRWSDIGLLFDYGYCLTAHKSQGSQFRDVVVRHETVSRDDADMRRRWIYTAVTRAAERLWIIP